MKTAPTPSELFKLENEQLEKLRALDFELFYAKPENAPALQAKIDATVDEISHLEQAIRGAELNLRRSCMA
jgi:hypothetical protein